MMSNFVHVPPLWLVLPVIFHACRSSLLVRSLSLCPSCSYADVFHAWRLSCWVPHPTPFVISVLLTSSMLTSFLVGYKDFRPFCSNADFFHADVQTLSCFLVIITHVGIIYDQVLFLLLIVSLVTSLIFTSLTSFSPPSCCNADVPSHLPAFFTKLTSLTFPYSSCSMF